MSTTNYYSVGGKILGHKVQGQPASSRVDYQTDALGSVTATTNQAGVVQSTRRYKPYGSLLAKVGADPDPAFTWVGSYGYKQTGKKYSDVYVRARHYRTNEGRWTTEDPIGYAGGINLSNYVSSMPITRIDPFGLKQLPPVQPLGEHIGCCGPDISAPMKTAMNLIKRRYRSWNYFQKVFHCNNIVELPTAIFAWDTIEVRDWANGISEYKKKYSNCATSPTCNDSLEIDGGCWYAGSVNYATFGVMMRLCDQTFGGIGWNKSQIDYLIWLYKRNSPNYKESVAWANQGYDTLSSTAPSNPLPDRRQCKLNCRNWDQSKQFAVFWYPTYIVPPL